MTTAQLIIICLTVLLLALMVVLAHQSRTDQQRDERIRLAEVNATAASADLQRRLDAEATAHVAQLERADADRAAAATPVAPAPGAALAVHFDGRVVQGTLDAIDADTLVLLDAKVPNAGTFQALGGRQHIPRSRVTQIQEF